MRVKFNKEDNIAHENIVEVRESQVYRGSWKDRSIISRAAERRGRGKLPPEPQGPRGFITPNASRSGGLIK